MSLEIVTEKIIGYMLEIDVFNTQGILLFQKGHILSNNDIKFLKMHNVYSVHATLPTNTSTEAEVESLGLDEQEEKVKQIDLQEQVNHVEQLDLMEQVEHEIVPEMTQRQKVASFQYRLHIKQAEKNYSATINHLRNLFSRAKEKEKADLEDISQAFEPMYLLSRKQKNLFHSLALGSHTERSMENYLSEHSLHVGLIASTMASLIGCSPDMCFEIGKAALVHDIGKILLPPSLLQIEAEGRLSAEELEEWKKHPRYGYELLRRSEGNNSYMLEGALYHHEQLDGTGYPSGLQGERIPLVAQIIAAANLYDNLISHHLKEERLSPYFASNELMNEAFAGHLNPAIVTSFIHFISPAYIGDYVRLSNGQQGKIIYTHVLEPHRPTIQLDSGKIINLQEERSLTIQEFFQMKSTS